MSINKISYLCASLFSFVCLVKPSGASQPADILYQSDLVIHLNRFMSFNAGQEHLDTLRSVSKDTLYVTNHCMTHEFNQLLCDKMNRLETDREEDPILNAYKKNLLFKVLSERINRTKKACFFVERHSGLNTIFLEFADSFNILTLNGFDFYKEHQGFFDEALFEEGDSADFKLAVAQHMLALVDVFIPKTSGLRKLLHDLTISLKDLKQKRNYVEFKNNMILPLESTAFIVVSDTDLDLLANFDLFDDIFFDNPNHTLVLDIKDTFVNQDGILELKAEDIPFYVEDLSLVNTPENVLGIGAGFLFDSRELISIDFTGLKNVFDIENCFLVHLENLIEFDPTGLVNLGKVGKSAFFNTKYIMNCKLERFIKYGDSRVYCENE